MEELSKDDGPPLPQSFSLPHTTSTRCRLSRCVRSITCSSRSLPIVCIQQCNVSVIRLRCRSPAQPGPTQRSSSQRLQSAHRFQITRPHLVSPVSDIRWIGAEENYVRICTGSETHLLRETMASMEQRLDPRSFLRVHRSAIVNLQYVKEVRSEPKGDFVVQLVNGHKVSMSRGYHARIGELLARA